jgi:hypothetical protein
MPNDNIAGDFAEVLNQETERGQEARGVPPLHPKEREKWVNLEEEDPLPGMPNHNLFQMPKRKLKAHYRRFDLSDELHVEELENIQNLCLAGNGYLLAREEWETNKDGETFAIVKYLEPINEPKDKKRTDDE